MELILILFLGASIAHSFELKRVNFEYLPDPLDEIQNWIPWTSSQKEVPENAVKSGFDTDNTELFMIRANGPDGNFLYGKFSAEKGHA